MENILQKLKLIQENPGFYKGLSPEEQAELFIFLLTPKPIFKKKPTIVAKDGYTPVKDKDYLSIEKTYAALAEMKAQIDARLAQIPTPKDGIDGKDAEITPDLIDSIVLEVLSLVKLPDHTPFDDTELVRLIDELRLDHEQLRDDVERLKLTSTQIYQAGGGVSANWVKSYVASNSSSIAATFETVSKNLDATDATINYTGDDLTSIDYANGITKTINYTGDLVTSIVLSGTTPSGIELTKTLNYTGVTLTSVVYS